MIYSDFAASVSQPCPLPTYQWPTDRVKGRGAPGLHWVQGSAAQGPMGLTGPMGGLCRVYGAQGVPWVQGRFAHGDLCMIYIDFV